MSHFYASDVSATFQNGFSLQGISLALKPGEVVGLIGPNGSGKSTLLKVLQGTLPRSSGDIQIDGEKLERVSGIKRAQTIGYMAQQGEIHWPLSVEKIVSLGRTPYSDKQGTMDVNTLIDKAMEMTDVLHLRGRRATELSGGEKARVLLARVLAGEPSIIFADEPVAALDPAHQLSVMSMLRSFASSGGSSLVVFHDLTLAARYCDRLILLDSGKPIISGPPSDVLTHDILWRVYGIRAKLLSDDELGLMVVPYLE